MLFRLDFRIMLEGAEEFWWEWASVQKAAHQIADPKITAELADKSRMLGIIGNMAGREDEAEKMLRMACNEYQRLRDCNPPSSEVAQAASVTLNELGEFYSKRSYPDDLAKALNCFQACRDILKEMLGTNLECPETASNFVGAIASVSRTHALLGDFATAFEELKPGVEMARLSWNKHDNAKMGQKLVALLLLSFQHAWSAGNIEEAVLSRVECRSVFDTLKQQGVALEPGLESLCQRLH
ncbi:MAG: hypothetical protein HYV27_12025 [Candidatus Hydrogenedentes bacterium]|nr:hypothetical protein [Candidatus Hydrogenedentota bacterium]